MAFDELNSRVAAPAADTTLTDARVAGFLRSVYGWMCGGLAITAGVALWVSSTPGLV